MPSLRVQAHAALGGGKELTVAEFQLFFDRLFTLQYLTDRVVEALLVGLPETVRAAQKAWDERFKSVAERQSAGDAPVRMPDHPLQHWVDSVLVDGGGGVSIDRSREGAVALRTNPSWSGAPFSIELPDDVYKPFARAYAGLTGVQPFPFVFLRAVQYKDWRNARFHEDESFAAGGWALSAVVMPHDQ